MAEPLCEDEGALREWSPETRLLQQIPLRVQRGIFSCSLNLTCVDSITEYIALGTNCGLIYWYCRATNELQRLRLENSNNCVTCVKIVSTVDYMVAGGTDSGNVTLFQIPKAPLPNLVANSLKMTKKNQVERFTINGLHNAPVTNIEWSQNGMRLFSGDKNGLVVLTEIDFYMHLSKSMELLNEQFEIVQLSYNQQILLISTTFRSIICDGLDKWKVHQVGTKDRKMLGKFGASFCKFDNKPVIYASRPGHRLWLANTDGSVQQTLVFKSVIPSSITKIQLINPIGKRNLADNNFGKVVQFGSNKLISYNSEVMYVLHPGAISVVSVLDSVKKIVDLSVSDDEIFILENERSLLRLGYTPHKYSTDITLQEASRRRSFIFDDLASKLKDTAVESFKKITSEFLITPEKTSPSSPPVLADEALDLPPIVSLPSGSLSAIIPDENVEIHFSVDAPESEDFTCYQEKLGDASLKVGGKIVRGKECEEVLSRPLRRRNPKRSKMFTLTQGQDSESDTTSNASEDRLVWGIASEISLSDKSNVSMSQSQSSFSMLKDVPTLISAKSVVKPGALLDATSETPDDKSQISLDTCESVSEQLKLTPERFLEEQEKTFFRLANQEVTLLDSCNSENTDNMSVSFNMTPSSSISSKMSENAASNCEASDNASMVSDNKTDNSQSLSNNTHNDELPLPRHLCFCAPNTEGDGICNQDENRTVSLNTSFSSKDSQQLSEVDHLESHDASSLSVALEERDLRRKVGKYSEYSDGTIEIDFPLERQLTIKKETKSTSDYHIQGTRPRLNVLDSTLDAKEVVGKGETDGDEDINELAEESRKELVYGPPSGSSTLGRDASTDSFLKSAFHSVQNVDQPDRWLQYQAPGPIACVALSDNYAVCINAKDQVYYSELSGLSLLWNQLTYKAMWISISNNSSVVWVLYRKSLFSLISPAKKGPFSENMLELTSNVRSVALSNSDPEGWILMSNGQVKCQRNLLGTPMGKPEIVPSDWLLTSVACWNGVVMAITSEESVVCKPPNEEIFRSIMTPRPVTKYIELGPDNLAWIVDDRNCIYFSDDFLSEEPSWWYCLEFLPLSSTFHRVDFGFLDDCHLLSTDPSCQQLITWQNVWNLSKMYAILICDYIFQTSPSILQNVQNKLRGLNMGEHIGKKITMVITNCNSVWVVDKFSTSVRVNKTCVNGYMWNKIEVSSFLPSVKWQLICGSGIIEDDGLLWLLSNTGDLFAAKPNSKHFQSVPVPCEEIRCVSSSTNVLWVLSSDGFIYARLGLNRSNSLGCSWRELHSPGVSGLRFVWIGCGLDVTWACDARGKMYVATGSTDGAIRSPLDRAWLQVEGKPKEGNHFEKVFVGYDLSMVWAIDNKENVYVREGVSPEYPQGTNWVFVTGLQATTLTISSHSVWALSQSGCLYRRYGITQSNRIGEYWKQIPGTLKSVTASSADRLWGIDDTDSILRLTGKTRILSPKAAEEKSTLSNEDCEEWEMPDGLN